MILYCFYNKELSWDCIVITFIGTPVCSSNDILLKAPIETDMLNPLKLTSIVILGWKHNYASYLLSRHNDIRLVSTGAPPRGGTGRTMLQATSFCERLPPTLFYQLRLVDWSSGRDLWVTHKYTYITFCIVKCASLVVVPAARPSIDGGWGLYNNIIT